MLSMFMMQAAVSPKRQWAFRQAVTAHVLVLLACVWSVRSRPEAAGPFLGQVLLTAAICEGALLLGWRLTQLPKNLGLEFLLASPLPASALYLGEMSVAVLRFALVTLSGLPLLAWLVRTGHLSLVDLIFVLLVPF